MDTLLKHNNETKDKFDEEFEGLWLDGMIDYESGRDYSEQETKLKIKDFITSQNTELLKKIAKGEIERIKGKIKEYEELYKQYSDTYTNILKEELTHWQQVLEDNK